jgi:hypothetical protein
MKESFINISSLTNEIGTLGDMDLQYFLSSLSGSTSEFTSANVQDALKSVASKKENAFSDAYRVTQTRNMGNTAQGIDSMIQQRLETSQQNGSMVGRQYEINEWSNSNKLDTLFFMQILFICITFVTVMMFLKVRGFISATLFTVVSVVAGLVASIALILRARYTSVVRDSRYWHKARFPSVANPYPTPPQAIPVCRM